MKRRDFLKAGLATLALAVMPKLTLAQALETKGGTMKDKKVLIAYFSLTGNTREIARQIQAQTGGDLFEIKTVETYPQDYQQTVDKAREEQNAQARPALTATVPNMADYDVVFIGYPNWWGTMPMGVFTFMESYDFSNKTLLPFCTHEGSRMGRSETDVQKLAPSATVLKGLPIRGSSVTSASAKEDVKNWLQESGF